MELTPCILVLLFATDPVKQAEVIAWLAATLDSFQCGPAAFLVRGCDFERLIYGLEYRLPNREGYFICTVDYPASFRRAPADKPPLSNWLFKEPITAPASADQFSFCIHCGTRVEPYSAYEEDGVELLRTDKPLRFTSDVIGGIGCYWCRSCESLWRAPGNRDTAQYHTCGHLVSMAAMYCPNCGIKTAND